MYVSDVQVVFGDLEADLATPKVVSTHRLRVAGLESDSRQSLLNNNLGEGKNLETLENIRGILKSFSVVYILVWPSFQEDGPFRFALEHPVLTSSSQVSRCLTPLVSPYREKFPPRMDGCKLRGCHYTTQWTVRNKLISVWIREPVICTWGWKRAPAIPGERKETQICKWSFWMQRIKLLFVLELFFFPLGLILPGVHHEGNNARFFNNLFIVCHSFYQNMNIMKIDTLFFLFFLFNYCYVPSYCKGIWNKAATQ